MAQPQFAKDEPIVRKDPVPERDRTPDRDRAADVIEEMWPADLSTIAEASEYSRSHIQNTLGRYFEQPDDTKRGSEISITVPRDVDHPPSYLAGFVDGFREGFEQ